MSEEAHSAAAMVVLRLYAVVLLAIGLGLAGGGGYLLSLGGSPYYVLCGIAVVASGVLLWQRRAEGALLYGLMLLATVAWAIWEAGYDHWGLMARIVAPAVLGIVLLIPVVRRTLRHKTPAWSLVRTTAAVAAALVIGVVSREGLPPTIHSDPVYQAGIADKAPAPQPVPDGAYDGTEWRHYGNVLAGTRFSPLDQITPENVAKLETIWSYRVTDEDTRLLATPLKIGGTLYLCDDLNNITALNAETGERVWRYDANVDVTKATYPICRGVTYYKVPDAEGVCAERVYTNTNNADLIALDARTGKRCADFGKDGIVSLLTGLGDHVPGYYFPTSAPALVRGKLVIGGQIADNQYWGEPSGVIRAYDAVTGALAWAWDMGNPDRKGEPPEGESYTHSTPNSWGPMSADEELGMVYVPTGNPTPDYFGAQRRPFDEKYGSSVVALDAETGEARWSFQVVHHDLWDYDVASQPSLIDLPTVDGVVPALVLPNKRAELFVLNRVTGEPIYPVEEVPVPQTGGPPEDWLSPTQPFSVGMPSFRGPDLVEGDMWGVTPLDQLWCRMKFREARYDGPMTPPGLTPAIQWPGYTGGMNWGSVALDVARKIAVVNTTYIPIYTRLIPRAEADALGIHPMAANQVQHFHVGSREAQEGTPYGILTGWFMSPLGIPCSKPPYGKISAVDLTSGKLIWSKPFGTAEDQGPLGIRSRLPLVSGSLNVSGAAVTQSGLIFIGSSMDRHFRAFDTATGNILWDVSLTGTVTATPVTYLSTESGRQLVVAAVSGSDGAQKTGNGGFITAFALPKGTDTPSQ